MFVERGGFEPPKLLKVTERLPRSPFVLCHLLDILPQLKYMGFLVTNVTAIEAIRLNGLTATHQFVDAPTKAF